MPEAIVISATPAPRDTLEEWVRGDVAGRAIYVRINIETGGVRVELSKYGRAEFVGLGKTLAAALDHAREALGRA